MSTTTQVQKVKINKMTKARYGQTTPVATEFYMLTDVLDPQYDVLPTADAKYTGQITQYTGESVDGGYTNGYFYKCTAQGTSPETYAWEQTDVQPSSGGSYLPLSGGTVTGEVNIEKDADDGRQTLRLMTGTYGLGFRSYYLEVLNYNGSSYSVTSRYQFDDSGFVALLGYKVLGDLYHPWSAFYLSGDIIFVDNSYNAHAISLPATAGTMAVIANDTAGTNGQVLTKTSNGIEWANAGGGGAVDSVNGQTGTVVLDGEDINATVGGETDTVTGHLTTVTNDLDAETQARSNADADLADAIAEKAEIDDSTTSTTTTWSSNKLNTMIGNIESLLANI